MSIEAAEKAESTENSASAKFEAMHARGIVWISTIAAAKLVQKAEPADAAMLAEKDDLLRQALDALVTATSEEGFEQHELNEARVLVKAIRSHIGVKND